MRVVIIKGSPRKKGSSSTLADHFGETARAKGASVKEYNLNTMNYKGCQGCSKCKTKTNECVLKDDLSDVLSEIHKADVMVLSSPIYYHTITAQLKGFIDRTYSFLNPDFFNRPAPCRLPAGKKSLLILTQAADSTMHKDVAEEYDYFLKSYGFTEREIVRLCSLNEENEKAAVQNELPQIEIIAQKFLAGHSD